MGEGITEKEVENTKPRDEDTQKTTGCKRRGERNLMEKKKGGLH